MPCGSRASSLLRKAQNAQTQQGGTRIQQARTVPSPFRERVAGSQMNSVRSADSVPSPQPSAARPALKGEGAARQAWTFRRQPVRPKSPRYKFLRSRTNLPAAAVPCGSRASSFLRKAQNAQTQRGGTRIQQARTVPSPFRERVRERVAGSQMNSVRSADSVPSPQPSAARPALKGEGADRQAWMFRRQPMRPKSPRYKFLCSRTNLPAAAVPCGSRASSLLRKAQNAQIQQGGTHSPLARTVPSPFRERVRERVAGSQMNSVRSADSVPSPQPSAARPALKGEGAVRQAWMFRRQPDVIPRAWGLARYKFLTAFYIFDPAVQRDLTSPSNNPAVSVPRATASD